MSVCQMQLNAYKVLRRGIFSLFLGFNEVQVTMHKPKLIPDWNDTRSSETSGSEDIMKTEIQAYGT